MRIKKTTVLTDLLQHGKLRELQQKTSLISALSRILKLYLDPRLQPLVHISSYQQQTLTLTCAHHAAAMQLKYLSRTYKQQLRHHPEFYDLSDIRTVIRSATPEAEPPPSAPLRRLSPATAALLLNAAEGMEGREVSEALRRLARHVDIKKDEA